MKGICERDPKPKTANRLPESEAPMSKNEEIFSKVFQKLTDMMETAGRWVKPWEVSSTPHVNLVTGKPYRGYNVLALSISRDLNGFSSTTWLTMKQVRERKGKVIKGSKSTAIVYFRMLEVDAPTADDPNRKRTIPMLKYSNVFNVEQCEGIKDTRAPKPVKLTKIQKIKACEDLVANYEDCPPIEHGGDSAYFSPSIDKIRMPLKKQFHSKEEYYSTLFHELVHSTGHKKRLDRLEPNFNFGDHSYSREELVAEIGASFLRHLSGVDDKRVDENSASYLKSWWKKLEKNPDDLRWASAKAQKAVDYMTGAEAPVYEDSKKEVVNV